MKFLTVLIIVTFYRSWMGGSPLREQFPAAAWFSATGSRIAPGNLNFLVSVLVPSVLLLLLSMEIQGWLFGLFWLVLSVLVLVYCLEFIDTDIAFDDQFRWLESLSDDEDQDEDHIVQLQQTQANFSGDITYHVFQNVAPALFWFLVLGPAGALFFYLGQHYLEQLEEDDQGADLLELVIFWMEWIPARFTILFFAVLGEFSRTWEVFSESLFEIEDAAINALSKAADSAVGRHHREFSNVADFVKQTEVELNLLKPLLERSYWGWLGAAAILTILGL